MIIYKEKTETKTFKKQVPAFKQCDVCTREYSFDADESNNTDLLELDEFTHISFTGGYCSVFEDGGNFELDICQHCLKEKLGEYIRSTGADY